MNDSSTDSKQGSKASTSTTTREWDKDIAEILEIIRRIASEYEDSYVVASADAAVALIEALDNKYGRNYAPQR